MDQFLAFLKDYGLLSGAGLVVLTGLGWLVKRAFSKSDSQQAQTVGPGGQGYQAGGNITVVEHKDD